MELHPDIRHQPAPDHPGWWTWDIAGARFNQALGPLLVRADGPGRAVCRMFPGEAQSNLQDKVHGGALLTLIDMAFFAGGYLAGAGVASAVTLNSQVQFLHAADVGTPLDAEIELLRETLRLAFFRGLIVQDGTPVAEFSGALRKANAA